MTNKKNKSSTIKRLLKYFLKNHYLIGSAIILTFISNYLALLIPNYSGKAIDAIGIKGNVNFNSVFTNCKLMLL